MDHHPLYRFVAIALSVIVVTWLLTINHGQATPSRPLVPGEPLPAWLLFPYPETATPYDLMREAFIRHYGGHPEQWPFSLDNNYLQRKRLQLESTGPIMKNQIAVVPEETARQLSKMLAVELSYLDALETDGDLPLVLHGHRVEPALLDWFFQQVFPWRIILDHHHDETIRAQAREHLEQLYEQLLRNEQFAKARYLIRLTQEIDTRHALTAVTAAGQPGDPRLIQEKTAPIAARTREREEKLTAARHEAASRFYRTFFSILPGHQFPAYPLNDRNLLVFDLYVNHESPLVTYASIGRVTGRDRDDGRTLDIALMDRTDWIYSQLSRFDRTKVLADTGDLIFIHGFLPDDRLYQNRPYLMVLTERCFSNLAIILKLPTRETLVTGLPIDLPPQVLATVHDYLSRAFSEAAAAAFNTEAALLEMPAVEWPEPPQRDVWLRTANIIVAGTPLDPLRGRFSDLQQRFDLLTEQVNNRQFSLAQTNLNHFKEQLDRLREAVVSMPEPKEWVIAFMGLPTDAAMAELRALQIERDNNYRLSQHAHRQISAINNLLEGHMQNYISAVWRGLYQSLLDWHSPPEWYEIPSTFRDWYEQSQEHADAIITQQEAINRLRILREELYALVAKAKAEHASIITRINTLTPVRELDGMARSIIANNGWTQWSPQTVSKTAAD